MLQIQRSKCVCLFIIGRPCVTFVRRHRVFAVFAGRRARCATASSPSASTRVGRRRRRRGKRSCSSTSRSRSRTSSRRVRSVLVPPQPPRCLRAMLVSSVRIDTNRINFCIFTSGPLIPSVVPSVPLRSSLWLTFDACSPVLCWQEELLKGLTNKQPKIVAACVNSLRQALQ